MIDYKIINNQIYLCYKGRLETLWYYINDNQWHCKNHIGIINQTNVNRLNNDLNIVKNKIRKNKLKRILNG